MTGRGTWNQMHARPGRSMRDLTAADLPEQPGIYALYRDGEPQYVGKATRLRDRVCPTKSPPPHPAVWGGSGLSALASSSSAGPTGHDVLPWRFGRPP